MSGRLREAGEPCWFNILTPDPAGARRFFAELLGWTFLDAGMGHIVNVGGRPVGALHDLAGPGTPAGTPPLVGAMVKVDGADAAAERIRALGGRARPPFDIGGAGRLVVCHDPAGAELDVWQPRAMLGTDVDPDAPGAPTWFEVLTPDVDGAARFYGGLFGWQAQATAPGQRVFEHGGRRVAGARRIGADAGPARWATFFAVADLEATARAALALGAEVVVPVTADARGARWCGIRSPQGVPFHVLERGG